jgi:hypothetical protein
MAKVLQALAAALALISAPSDSADQGKVYLCDGLDGEIFYTTEARARCVETDEPPPGTAIFRCVRLDGVISYSSAIRPDSNCSLVAIPRLGRPSDPSHSRSTPPKSNAVVPAQSFGAYHCTQDCSGHEAGYDWAEENGIEDVSDCGGNSNSFIEGCEEYVEENFPDFDEDGIPDEEEDAECIDDDEC